MALTRVRELRTRQGRVLARVALDSFALFLAIPSSFSQILIAGHRTPRAELWIAAGADHEGAPPRPDYRLTVLGFLDKSRL